MYIVTGGAGFIGSNLVRMLNKQGIDDILIVDNLGHSQKYLNLNRLKFADYLDKEEFLKKVHKMDKVKAILHQGACSATTETDANYLIRNNYEYSKELLHYCLNNEVDFIYASSASVYGNGDNGFTEQPECEYPLNGYAFSKFIFDNYVRRIYSAEKYTTQVAGLRYFNVYGYQENHKGSMASVPFHFFNQAEEGEEIKVFDGSENFLRDFIIVDDVAKVVQFLLESKISGIYNCGTGVERSFQEMAEIFVRLHGKCRIKTIPFPEHLKGKYQAFTKADLTNLRKAGYNQEFTSLEEGIATYLEQLKKTGGYL
jgi:ADP-L-glycero-D-manno-heptose 6-epimerase